MSHAKITTSRAEVASPSVSPGLVMAVVIVFWGFGPPISKLITAPAVVSVFYRFWISVPLLYLLAAARGHPLRASTIRQAALRARRSASTSCSSSSP